MTEDDYRLAPGTAPLARCVGAFRRPCLMLTTAVMCDDCWVVALGTEPRARKRMRRRYRVARPPALGDVTWTPGAVRVPIRGEVR